MACEVKPKETKQEREKGCSEKDQKTESFFKRVRAYVKHNRWLVYVVPAVFFLFVSLIFGSSNIFLQISYSARIAKLEDRIDVAAKQLSKDSLYMEARYKSDDYELEEAARGKFMLKEPDEMVFLIVDSTKADFKP